MLKLTYRFLLPLHVLKEKESVLDPEGSARGKLSHCSSVHVLSMLKQEALHFRLVRLLIFVCVTDYLPISNSRALLVFLGCLLCDEILVLCKAAICLKTRILMMNYVSS